MTFSEDVIARLIIFILAVCGFFVAKHIHKHKKENEEPLVCPIQFDCATVVHSDYSKLLGISLEIFGMVYYALVAIAYAVLIFHPFAMPSYLLGALILTSSVAFLFSLYLIGIQAFVLKKGCSWCLVSAAICLFIFLITVFNYDFSLYVSELLRF